MLPTRVVWEIAAAPDMTRPLRSGSVITSAARDHTVKVDVDGLAPNTTYYYRFSSNRTMSEIGRTRTAPSPDADIDALNLGIVAHSPWSPDSFGAYRHLATQPDLSAIVHIGDYLGLGSVPLVGTSCATRCPTSLADFRNYYRQHRSDPDLRAAHSSAPWICPPPQSDAQSSLAEDDPARHANRAFFEWMPIREPQTGGDPGRPIRFGPLVDLFLAGARRDDPGRALSAHDRRQAQPSAGLQRSESQWKVVVGSVMMAPVNVTPLDPAAASVLAQLLAVSHDHHALLTEIERHATDNVVFVAGDSRMSWAGDVPTMGRSVAVQFAIPPVSAGVIGDLGPAVVDAVKATAGALNDHVRHLDPSSQGFGVLTAEKMRMRMRTWSVPALQQPAIPAQLIAEYRVTSGARRVTQVHAPAFPVP